MTPGGQYEFNDFENQRIMALGSRVRWWGILSLIAGGAGCLFGLSFLVLGGLAATADAAVGGVVMLIGVALVAPVILIYVVTGGLYVGSGNALIKVVRTQGNDIEHLLVGLDKLGKATFVEAMVMIIAFVVVIGGVALLIAAGGIASAVQ